MNKLMKAYSGLPFAPCGFAVNNVQSAFTYGTYITERKAAHRQFLFLE
ncbi:hypothetical protein [Pseudobacillus wudalianchiensis]|nr:hypothetical protein [Bacillus wudalianchiensis]